MSAGPAELTLCALGDLILAGEWDPLEPARLAGLRELRRLAGEHDLLFLTLETACEGREGQIPKQPRIVARAGTIADALRALAPRLVSLANNHAFDAHLSGHDSVLDVLRSVGADHLGSGRNAEEAARPALVDVRGATVGFLAYADAETHCSHLAGESHGVNELVPGRATFEVEALAARCDHVVVSLHWGVEYCDLPSPRQIELARRLVAAGARLVLGHHAHVVQGVETLKTGAIAYGLGNATTTDFSIDGTLAIRQTKRTRSGVMVRARLAPGRVAGLECLPFRWNGPQLERLDPYAARLLARADRRLARGVTAGSWRRRRLYEDVVVRTARKLRPSVVRSLRPRHLKTLLANLRRALSGEGSLL
jgi:poly-gamma-glutamate synthesis protein (capsule biosynthesis protein)